MDIHYNAFISYRHHPDDIRVASQIHRALEHYKIPRAIRKTSKGITRIFRDKEELPITSNLTDDITRALENSDFLIVICSTHTRESTWVQREIETFLKTHDRNKILTVLVNGEPYDTIPEILLSEERTDPLTGRTVSVPIEPLSCDWRIPARKARREELPRLAAALLGCGYNELRQRERQYRTRRMIVAFSLALSLSLGFMAYFIYSNTQIQQANEQLFNANEQLFNANLQITANLEQALKNQSQFLANASSEVLDNGDRLTAMLLALEALPEYEGERPYVAIAEQALSTAVGAYLADTQMLAVGAFNCGALVSTFQVTDDGSTIYILDERNNLSVWNTETFQQISATTLPAEFKGGNIQLLTTAKGNVLVYSSFDRLVMCFNPDGQILWQANDCSDIAFLGDQDTLMLLRSKYQAATGTRLTTIRFPDANTGEAVREELQILDMDPTISTVLFRMEVYPADAAIVLSTYPSDTVASNALDLETGRLTTLDTYPEDASITCAGYTADRNLVLAVIDDAFSGAAYYQNMTMAGASEYRIQCFTPAGQKLWEVPLTSYIDGFSNTIEMIPNSSKLFCLINNAICIIDSTTGQVLGRCETGSGPLFAQVGEKNTTIFLKDGSNGTYRYSNNTYLSIPYTKDNLTLGLITNGLYTHEFLSKQVTVYRSIRDEAYTAYTGNYPDLTIIKQMAFGNLLAIETHTDVHLFDTERRTLLWSDGGDYSFNTEIVGFSADGSILWCIRNDNIAVAYDTRSGSCQEYPLPEQNEYPKLYYRSQHRMVGENIFCTGELYAKPQELHLVCWNTRTQEYRKYLVCASDAISYNSRMIVLAADRSHALLWENVDNQILSLDLASGALTTLATDVTVRPSAHIRDDSSFLLGYNHVIQLRSFDGTVLTQVDLGERNAVSFCILGNEFLALCDGGNVYRYAGNGTFLSKTDLYIYNTFYSDVTSSSFDPTHITWVFTESGDLVINAFNYGNVIDCVSWERKADISNLVAYVPSINELVLESESSDVPDLISYPLRSTEQLKKMALDALNGLELTEEQRAFYGLLEE